VNVSEQMLVSGLNWGLGISFRFVEDNTSNAHIRIEVTTDGKSWSFVGNECADTTIVQAGKATMHFGWDIIADPGTVIHEFGHALGLLHEHQNPMGVPILFNDDVVQEELRARGWSDELTYLNILKKYDQSDIEGTKYDSKSIMHYPYPASWVQSGIAIESNHEISKLDAFYMIQLYPPNHNANGNNINGNNENGSNDDDRSRMSEMEQKRPEKSEKKIKKK